MVRPRIRLAHAVELALAVGAAAVAGFAPGAGAVEHVIHVSVDGLRSDLLDSLVANDAIGDFANFRRFVDEGATTYNARTDYFYTITLPNHVTMLTGRPVLQPAGQPNTVHHGWTSNSDPAPTQTLHNSGNLAVPYKASVFDVAHDNGLSTACYASKTKFVLFDQSYDGVHGAPDTVGVDEGRDKIDTYVSMSAGSPPNASNMHAAFVAAMTASPVDYCFAHYRDPDGAGHASGWGSAGWIASVRAVDDYLEVIFRLVETQPQLVGTTVVIVTTDHGGYAIDHQNAAAPSDYRIPFFVWGPGVEHGDLYALNATTRTDPEVGRPLYDEAPPIRNGDAANLVLALLGLGPIPGSTINAAQDLRVASATAVRATRP